MKTTLGEIKMLEKSLAKVFDKDVNIKTAYKLSQILKKFNEEMQTFEESRIKLVKKYGKEDEKTKQVEVMPENYEVFNKDLNELLTVEVEFDFTPIPLREFGDISLSAADIMRLDGKIIVEKTIVEEKK